MKLFHTTACLITTFTRLGIPQLQAERLAFSYRVTAATAEAFISELRKKMVERCEDLVWQILQQNDDSILYEGRINDCGPHADQHEVVGIIHGDSNRWRIAYTSETAGMPDAVRQHWIDWLSGMHAMTVPLGARPPDLPNAVPARKNGRS